jgi:3-hydroxybutyrate dehydrogenase
VETPVHTQRIENMMTSDALSREEAERRFLANKQPGGRFITAEDVAGMILFLCGPESRDITGAALPIDGGWSIS